MSISQAFGECSSDDRRPKVFTALLYHAVDDFPKHTHVSIENFRQQMSQLKAEGFTVEGVNGLEERLRTRNWPEKYVVLTFDDGHISLLNVAEELARYGFSATAFIITDLAKQGDREHLKAEEVSKIAAVLDTGSHSVTHSFLTELPPAEARRELYESKIWLEELLDRPVTSFSAPCGYLNSRIVKMAMDAGYHLLGNSVEWINNSDKLAAKRIINRVEVRRADTLSKFGLLVNCDSKLFLGRYCRSQSLLGLKSFVPSERIVQLARIYSSLKGSRV